jgi:hypothetical protein
MKRQRLSYLMLVAVVVVVMTTVAFGVRTAAEEKKPAQPAERIGVEDTFVRFAENEEGYVILGYRTANEAVGKEWMLLDVGMTLQEGVAPQKITRDHIKLVTPDRKVISLLTQEEYKEAQGALAAWQVRANRVRDSINHFPSGTIDSCRIEFYVNPGGRRADVANEEIDLISTSACVGRLFFRVPGNIQYGNYNLDVVFANSIVQVPMEIMTKERTKEFQREWKEALKESRHKDHKH